MKFFNVHSISIAFMFIYKKVDQQKKKKNKQTKKKKCLVILFQYTQIDSKIFNL